MVIVALVLSSTLDEESVLLVQELEPLHALAQSCLLTTQLVLHLHEAQAHPLGIEDVSHALGTGRHSIEPLARSQPNRIQISYLLRPLLFHHVTQYGLVLLQRREKQLGVVHPSHELVNDVRVCRHIHSWSETREPLREHLSCLLLIIALLQF